MNGDDTGAETRARPRSRPGRAPRGSRRRLLLTGCSAAAILAAVALLLGPRLLGDAREQADLSDFMQQPRDAAATGAPGSVVKAERLEGAPLDAAAWRVMYRTSDLRGESVTATATLVVPDGAAPAGGRTTLAWAHPTTGTARECAPSLGFDPFTGIEGLRELLDRGYAVVATDYVGMGTAGPNSYLVGATAGRSVLDSVRAATGIPEAAASEDVVLWGHSQGGQAVLFAAELAEDYAPELRIRAVAAAAPAADLTALLDAHLDDVSGATIGSYAFQAYAGVYEDRGADLAAVLTPEAQRIVPRVNELCLLANLDEIHSIAKPAVGRFFSARPSEVEPWATLLAENSAGGVAFEAPLFVAQGSHDRLVLPEDTRAFVERQRGLGMDVVYHEVEVADHATIAYLALPALGVWLDSLAI